VLLPGRRWALHAEETFSSYGRRGTFALAGGAGSYTWYGTKLDTRIGARYMLKQAAQGVWFVGGGINFNATVSYASREQYGPGSSRVNSLGLRLPTASGFLGAPRFGVGPYLETGVRRGRFTLSLDAMLGDGVSYNDPLTVQTAIRDPDTPSVVIDYTGYNYSAPLLAFRALLGFRLGHSPDQKAAQ
jgi:hypothetical protein